MVRLPVGGIRKHFIKFSHLGLVSARWLGYHVDMRDYDIPRNFNNPRKVIEVASMRLPSEGGRTIHKQERSWKGSRD